MSDLLWDRTHHWNTSWRQFECTQLSCEFLVLHRYVSGEEVSWFLINCSAKIIYLIVYNCHLSIISRDFCHEDFSEMILPKSISWFIKMWRSWTNRFFPSKSHSNDELQLLISWPENCESFYLSYFKNKEQDVFSFILWRNYVK